MDWSASGRIDSFEFEKILIKNLSASDGKLKNVIGGKLTFDFSSELKVSGTIEVVNTNFVNNCLIRVWYKPTLNGKTESIKLCTCFADTSEMKFENGQWSGTINLRSVLARHIDDQIVNNWVFKTNTTPLDNFKKVFSWLGGVGRARAGISNPKRKKAVVFQAGKTPMEVLTSIAKFASAEITCDTHGRTIIQKKYANSKRPLGCELLSGSYSVTLPGLTLEDTVAGTVNRVAVRHKYRPNGSKNEKTIKTILTVKNSHRASQSNQGRWISKCYDVSSLSPRTQAKLNKVAKNYLNTDSAVKRYWKLTCFYQDRLHEHCLDGKLVKFKYGKSLVVTGLLEAVDMSLSPGGLCELRIKEVRRSGSVQ